MDQAIGLIGRDDAVAALRADVQRVAGGSPGTVLLTGEPGVGKTRLARAALRIAADAGFAVFAGRARAMSREVAYAPLVEALGAHLRTAAGKGLIGDLGQLGLVFSGLGLTPPAPLGDPAMERSRMLDGFGRLVERLATREPLALLIDGLHATDTATFDLLAHLIACAADPPILLLATSQLDEPGQRRADEITRLSAESSWWLDRRQVLPLRSPDAAALVRAVLDGTPADPVLVDRIVERCAGRVFLLEALAQTVAEHRMPGQQPTAADIPLPEGVRAQMRMRVSGCTPDERAVLDVLAVAGDELNLVTIARAAELGTDRAAFALDGLHRRRLLQDSGFDLVHGILREALLAELSPATTQRLHARLLDAFEEGQADDARLAEHALGAGSLLDPARALTYLRRGVDRALALGLSEPAARYLEAAVPLARQVSQGPSLGELLEQLATAQRRLGRQDEARASWSSALTEYTRAAQPVAIARIQQELGQLDWSRGDLDSARMRFAAAERALDGLEPSSAHADMLFGKVITACRIGDIEAVGRANADLRALDRNVATPRLTAQVNLSQAMLDYAGTDYAGMLETTRRALGAAEGSGDPLLILRAYDQLSVAAASQLDIPALRQYTDASLRVARELGAPLLGGFPRIRLAVADLMSGDWDAALRVTAELSVLIQRYDERRGSVSSFAVHAWVLAHRGKLADARDYLDRAHRAASPTLGEDRNVSTMVAIAEVVLGLFGDDPARSARHGAELTVATGGWMPLLGLGLLGEARARCGDRAGADSICDQLRSVRSCATPAPRALIAWVQGHQAREQAVAARCFAEAAGLFAELGLVFLAARARLADALAVASRDPRPATVLASSALDTFEELGAPVQAQQSRELLRELGVVPSRGRRRSASPGPLSARELEVARLVAAGRSNADVAAALFISPRTVTTHLDRIYRRLGLSSRVALTRYLADSGLLDEGGATTP